MMDQTALISAIHATSTPLVLAITGGGASFIGELLLVPGGSKTLLEAIVPYSDAALRDWLRHTPEQACSERTALAMASVACARAQQLWGAIHPDVPATERPVCVGMSCTAALVSDRPKRGLHRAHLGIQTSQQTRHIELILEKGARDRTGEEAVVVETLLLSLCEVLGLETHPPVLRTDRDHYQLQRVMADPLLAEVWAGTHGLVWWGADQRWQATLPVAPVGMLCGSFDPLHFGHEGLRLVAERRLGGAVAYEISLRNVDKPPLDFLTIQERVAQFHDRSIVVTNAPTFVRKASLFPGMTFVVGSDTAVRIYDPRYYGGSTEQMQQALRQIREAGCRFLVAGRLQNGTWQGAESLEIPATADDLFEPIPDEEFRADITSTELRKQQVVSE